MNPEIKAQWVEALRSGDYMQGHNALRRGDKFCCLGVLCDLAVKTGVVDVVDVVGKGSMYFYGTDKLKHHGYFLPPAVQEWAGLDDESPKVVCDPLIDVERIDGRAALANLNDSNMPFSAIADLIEEQL